MRIDVLGAVVIAGIVIGGLVYGKDFVVTSIVMSAFYILALKTYGERVLIKLFKDENYRKKNGAKFFVCLSLATVPVLLLAARMMTAHKAPGDNFYIWALAFAGLLSGAAEIIHLIRKQPAEASEGQAPVTVRSPAFSLFSRVIRPLRLSTIACIGFALVGFGGAVYGNEFLVPSAFLCLSYFIWLIRYREAIWDRVFWLPNYRERNKGKILVFLSLLVMAGIFFSVRVLTGKGIVVTNDEYHFLLLAMAFSFVGVIGTFMVIGRQFLETD